VAQIETGLKPRDCLRPCWRSSCAAGGCADFPNAPRTLDLDIVLYGSLTLHEPGLTIPHPRMHERAFVLLPLAEIARDTVVPATAASPTSFETQM